MPFASPKRALYLLTTLAAALLLFTLLSNSNAARAQQAATSTPTNTPTPNVHTSSSPLTFSSISAGPYYQTCGLLSNGAAVCWGNNYLGLSTPPEGETFASISAGRTHTCGLRPNGTAVCWGGDTYGQSTPPEGETFASISAGYWHTCGLRPNGTAACWGRNNRGQTNTNDTTFTSIDAGGDRNCGIRSTDSMPVCWGDERDWRVDFFSKLHPAVAVKSISLHPSHLCGLRPNDTVVCWGNSDRYYSGYGEARTGHFAPGTFKSIEVGGSHTCGLRTNGTAVCGGYNDRRYSVGDDVGQARPPAGAFTSITLGFYHTCGLRTNGVVVCWGSNDFGESTPPTSASNAATPIPTNTPTATDTPTLTPTSVSSATTPTHTPTSASNAATPIPTNTPIVTDTPTLTPTSVSATDEPTPITPPRPAPHTPTPTTTQAAALEPTPTPTPTGAERIGAVQEQAEALLDQADTLQEVETGTLRRLIETLQALITALNSKLVANDGASPTPTNTPATVLESTPIATPTSTTIPTATPTQASTSALAPGCIRKIGLGWITGTWHSACLTDKTPATAKTGTRYARYYAFTLDAPRTVTVRITSTDVRNAYLYLLEGRGNEGSIVNRGDTQITEQLPAGTYTIEATTYALETAGNFTLTMDISTTTPAVSAQ